MLLALDAATKTTLGLLITFIGIGIIVNIILVFIFVQIRGEHRQNLEYQNARRRQDVE